MVFGKIHSGRLPGSCNGYRGRISRFLRSLWEPRKRPDHHNPRLALPLADKYDWWSRLDGELWARLLSDHPEFADRCDWTKLGKRDWFNLLDGRHDPSFAAHCPKEVFAYWRKHGFAFKEAP